MKSVLLDESVPVRLTRVLASLNLKVQHAVLAGHRGLPDKALLDICRSESFDAFLTCDQNLPTQQNLTSLPFGIVVICTNNLTTILTNLDEVVREVRSVGVGRCVETLKGAHRTRYGRTPRVP